MDDITEGIRFLVHRAVQDPEIRRDILAGKIDQSERRVLCDLYSICSELLHDEIFNNLFPIIFGIVCCDIKLENDREVPVRDDSEVPH